MSERKYSVKEIDMMRGYVRYMLHPPAMMPFRQEEVDARVENALRTYIAAGISPEELEEEAGGWESEPQTGYVTGGGSVWTPPGRASGGGRDAPS